MACAYEGTSATPRTYDDISDAVKNFDTTQEWFDFYLNEARRLKNGENLPTLNAAHHQAKQQRRFEYLGNFAAKAVSARKHHLDNGVTRFAARASTAKAGAIPGLKSVVKPMAVSYFSAEAIKHFGMADREDVNRFYREALSKAGLVTNLSEFLEQLDDQIQSEHRKELIKEVWKDEDMQERLMEEMYNDFGEEMATNLAEEAAHLAPIVGQAVSAFRGWHSSGKAMDKALDYLSNAALEFHKKAFIPVVVARTFPQFVLPAVQKKQTWSNWLSQAAASVLEALPEGSLSVGAGAVVAGLTGTSVNPVPFKSLDQKCWGCRRSRAVCRLRGGCATR